MASKMKFIYEQDYPNQVPTSTTFEINGDVTLTDVLENFQLFLRGAGFYFDGVVDIVNDEADYDSDDEDSIDLSQDSYEVNIPAGSIDDSFFLDDINLDLSTMAAAGPTFTVSDSTTSDTITFPANTNHSVWYYDTDRNK